MKTEEFEMYLRSTNLSENTISSYLFAVKQFFGQYDEVTKRGLRDHKIWLIESYKPKTVNLRIRAINCYLESIGKGEMKLQFVRVQQKAFLENVISEADYEYFKNEIIPQTGFSLDYSSDVRAVELLSILKNMYAIAIGLVSGRYNSPNVDFLVYTKAVNEMRKLLKLFGCDEETIFRYSGIGDLGLTSLNDLSRNRTFGMLIGKGFAYDDMNSGSTVIEGRRTIKLIGEMTREQGKEDEFPLVQALYRLMYEKESLNNYIVTALE